MGAKPIAFSRTFLTLISVEKRKITPFSAKSQIMYIHGKLLINKTKAAFTRLYHPLSNGAGDGNRTHVRSLGSSYSAIELRPLPGGEGGIRTPDAREGMHDFESCAFNQALPSLQMRLIFYQISYRKVKRRARFSTVNHLRCAPPLKRAELRTNGK